MSDQAAKVTKVYHNAGSSNFEQSSQPIAPEPTQAPIEPAAQEQQPTHQEPSVAEPQNTETDTKPTVSDVNPTTTDVKPTETDKTEVEAEPKPDPNDAKFAALARKEKELQVKQQQLKEQMSDPDFQRFQEAKKNRDYKAAMEALGVEFDDLANYKLAGDQLTPEMEIKNLRQEIQEMRNQQAELEKKKQQEDTEKQVRSFQSDIRSHIDTNPEKFELIAIEDAYDTVYATIEQHWNQTYDHDTGRGEVLPIEDAAELVEEHLTKRAKAIFEKSKRFKPQAPVEPEPKTTASDTPSVGQPTVPEPTLTNNNMMATPSYQYDFMDEEDSKAKAAEVIRRRLAEQR